MIGLWPSPLQLRNGEGFFVPVPAATDAGKGVKPLQWSQRNSFVYKKVTG